MDLGFGQNLPKVSAGFPSGFHQSIADERGALRFSLVHARCSIFDRKQRDQAGTRWSLPGSGPFRRAKGLLVAVRRRRIPYVFELIHVREWPRAWASSFIACRDQGKGPWTIFSLEWLDHFLIVGRNRPAHQWPDLFDQSNGRGKTAVAAFAGKHSGACRPRLFRRISPRYNFSFAIAGRPAPRRTRRLDRYACGAFGV